MQLLLDFLPILSFFVAYKFSDVYVATGVMMGVLLLVVAFQWIRHRKIGPMLIVSAAVGLIFGGLTIWLHDQTFVQWKPTVVYWLMAGALLAGGIFTKKPTIQYLMDTALQLPDAVWRTMNTVWAIGFAVIGAINLAVMYSVDFDTWVNFKAFGLTALTLVFAVGQSFWLANKLPPEEAPTESDKPT